MIICLGPVCIPIWSLFPFLLALFKQAYEYLFGGSGSKRWEKESNKQEQQGQGQGQGQEHEHQQEEYKDSAGQLSKRLLEPNEDDDKVVKVKTREEWDEKIRAGRNSVCVVKFTAGWCKPCKKIAPAFHDLAVSPKYINRISFLEVDYDESGLGSLVDECKVEVLPTFVLLKGGNLLDSISGADEDKLQAFVEKANAF